ncbi:hypothetical protein F383_29608 [Gossypium arboreum]|uniref:Uncharacterized protein n=1 Tax=Gossypium arboreum TaxID=29729 RepID=A0A0B0P545_GOSAR|nr:hypothetical protein F383_26315 [Gossypium arboreum]KHG23645.1 hypothetical protein F383_29608 [Gossypium arboreum]
MATHARCAKPERYTDLCHKAKSHACVLDHVKHTYLISISTPEDTRPCNLTVCLT